MRGVSIVWLACIQVSVAVSAGAAEGLEPPTGADWQQHCAAYFKTLEGDASADDLDVTYCVGMTAGIVAGMRLGSQLGALSMASSLAVDYELDTQEVFAKFESKDADALLQICPPPQPPMSAYIRAVDAYLKEHPEKRDEPLAQLLFEALQSAWKCAS
jgi:hypothetical protein